MTTYDVGDRVRMSLTVKSTGGQNTSADVKLVIASPSSDVTILSSQLTSTATGEYRYDITLSRAGRWTYQFMTTGTVIASEGNAFAVRPLKASTS